MTSRVGAINRLSCRLAPVKRRPSGVPRASVTRWRFVPGLPRSVGFGPVAGPPFWPGRRRCPGSLGASRSRRPRESAPAEPDAGAPTPRPPASPADAASNSCPSRSSSRPVATPTECPCAERTGCRSARRGSPREDDHLGAEASRQEEAARSPARDRREGSVWPSPPTRHNPFC